MVVEFPVRWGELDALGHVNNAVFFQWFESARIAFFERMGFPTEPDGELSPVLAQTECEFLQPVLFPADIKIGTRVAELGRTSLVMQYLVELGDGTPAARGKAVVVLVNLRTGKPSPIPEAARERIAGFQE